MATSDEVMENRRKTEAVLNEHLELIAPRECLHGVSWNECESGCEYSDTKLMSDVVMTDFVIVIATTNLNSGDTYITKVVGPDTRRHHEVGMLHMALHDTDWA